MVLQRLTVHVYLYNDWMLRSYKVSCSCSVLTPCCSCVLFASMACNSRRCNHCRISECDGSSVSKGGNCGQRVCTVVTADKRMVSCESSNRFNTSRINPLTSRTAIKADNQSSTEE